MSLSVIQTPLFGGVNGGKFFNDLLSGGWPGQLNLNLNHPISQVSVAAGWEIDGIGITYNLANGSQVSFVHGSNPNTAVNLGATEYIQSIIGRAGYQTYYKASLVNQLTFVIVDNSTLAVRTAGPFGNGDESNNGSPFTVSNPIALSGYSTEGVSALGLSGLSFVKSTGGF
ncbi:hypothetical protein PHLCEN_2v1191 [Hermanssonia centrifuga]|uniref:Jacalin-type lectin domain-containing protein n=1 Tax=Hermanssonia centrifuga TaxID=98765 RepID=A0A2R6S3Z7_9APHY|nr:hypothetical protein PHLCEN_2v1191 [Hermanssonia centrifuga]